MINEIIFSTMIYLSTSSFFVVIDTTPRLMMPPFVLTEWICLAQKRDEDYDFSEKLHKRGFVCKWCRVEEMRMFGDSKKIEKVIRGFYFHELKRKR